jgi:hypothetical protein
MLKVTLSAVAALLALNLIPNSAQAQTRVFVAAQGSDSNSCSFALPCRTFQHAHDTVAAGGEIDVLDPAGYGALTITKSISIQGHGFSGISVAPGGNGIMVNAGATDRISLNGLLVEGGAVGGFGIFFNSGGTLVVENCVVRNFATTGLLFRSSASTLQTLGVSNSYFTDNAGGVVVSAIGTGAVSATIERSAFHNNTTIALYVVGASGTGAVNVAITDSVASNTKGSSASGFRVQSDLGHSVTKLMVTHCTVAGNDIGLEIDGPNATLRLAQSTVVENTMGYGAFGGGVILSYGDNYIDDNGATPAHSAAPPSNRMAAGRVRSSASAFASYAALRCPERRLSRRGAARVPVADATVRRRTGRRTAGAPARCGAAPVAAAAAAPNCRRTRSAAAAPAGSRPGGPERAVRSAVAPEPQPARPQPGASRTAASG